MSSSSSPASGVHVVEDCLGLLQLLSDGTVVRSLDADRLPPPPAIPSDLPVQWKDVVYDAAHDLRLRMYKPSADIAEGAKKLPVLVYFHAGGFCMGSFELPNFHAGSLRLAAELPAIVLSGDYRLAPEQRLPAAHDDAMFLLSWLQSQAASPAGAEPWLTESADFSRVFVSGDSSGGNMVHHVAVRLGSEQLGLDPVRIAGYVLISPYFGGEERTASEVGCPADAFLNLALFDQMWRLSLPVGATRDHPVANPFGPWSPVLDRVTLSPVLVISAEHDMMHDRTVDYATRLKAMGKPVELVEIKGQAHGFLAFDPWGEASSELIRVAKLFVYGVVRPN